MQKYTRTTTHSAIWFKKTDDAGDLEIKPLFQRNPVWSDIQKSSLIDTILMELPIPEIYMQEITGPDGTQKHILVDGQQRIRAVLSFMRGELEIDDQTSKWNEFSFDDLTDEDKKKVFEYTFVVRVLPGELREEEVRSIFQRLNKNTTILNSQELRHATYWGSFITLMESLADLQFWTDAGIFSANDRRRMLDVEFISELAVAVLNGHQNKKKKLEEFYVLYEQEFPEEEELRTLFFMVLGEIEQILPEISKTRWKKKSDFYSLFLEFAEHAKRLPLTADKRLEAQTILRVFSEQVDQVIRDGNEKNADDRVSAYLKAVEKAASDLGSRKERARILSEVLNKVFPSIG
jgi:hypothetical protein